MNILKKPMTISEDFTRRSAANSAKTYRKKSFILNREEDMGLENLRHAKEALKPDHMEEKYSGCFL